MELNRFVDEDEGNMRNREARRGEGVRARAAGPGLMPSALEAALASWAEDAGCAEIDLEGSTEFVWVWMGCFMYAAAAVALALMPIYWCFARSDQMEKDDEDAVQAGPDLQRVTSNRSSVSRRPPSPDLAEQDPEPNLEAALLHLRKTSPTDCNCAWRSVWGTRLEDLNMIGGTGTELYFRLLQFLGIVFVFMSTLTMPISAFSMRGQFAPDTGQVLSRTTIGNLAQLPAGGLAPEERYIILGCQGLQLTRLTAVFSWLDFAAVVLFLATVAGFRFYLVPRTIELDDAEHVTAKDFAVEIEGLPPLIERQTEYRELLTQHLVSRLERAREQGFAKKATQASGRLQPPPLVRELVLVRDYDGRLGSLEERARLLQQKAIAVYKQDEKAVGKLEKRIEKLTKRLEKAMQPEQELPVVRAYAILNTTLDKRCLIFDYRFTAYRMLRCCLPESLRFGGHMIRIKQAPDPTNILWENQDMSWIEHLLRQGFSWLVFVLLLVVSLVLVYFASSAARQEANTSMSYLGVSSCDPSGDPNDAALQATKCLSWNASTWTLDYAVAQGGATLDCFCSTKGHTTIIQDSALTSACTSWLEKSATSIAIMGLATLAVVIINVVVKAILIIMAEFERPTSMSALSSSMMVKVSVAQTINTVVVVTLVNYFGPDELRAFADIIPFGQLLFRGDFSDATRGWYTIVGGAICMNMLVNAFTPGITNLALTALNSLWRHCRTKSQKHQAELIELYTNPPFDISARYAQLLTTVFCTLVYSSGLPLLTLFAAMYMLATYWSDKLVLLWGSQRPPAYDAEMPKDAAGAMLYAVGLHCMVAVLMYGQSCTFPSLAVGGALASASAVGSEAISSGDGGGFISWLNDRISRETTWMFFVLLVLLLAFWACRTLLWIIGGTVGEALTVMCAACRTSARVADEEGISEGMTWTEAARHIEMACPPASYRMDMRMEFKELVKYLRDTESGVTGVVPSSSSGKLGDPEANANAAEVQKLGGTADKSEVSLDSGSLQPVEET